RHRRERTRHPLEGGRIGCERLRNHRSAPLRARLSTTRQTCAASDGPLAISLPGDFPAMLPLWHARLAEMGVGSNGLPSSTAISATTILGGAVVVLPIPTRLVIRTSEPRP